MLRLPVVLCALAGVLGSGCGSDRATRGEGTLDVAATTGPLAYVVRNAGGRRVRVTTVTATARDALEEADLVIRSAARRDRWIAPVVDADRLLTLPSRWWDDHARLERTVKEVRNELARRDVHGAGHYEAATADFLERLRNLDREAKDAFRPR